MEEHYCYYWYCSNISEVSFWDLSATLLSSLYAHKRNVVPTQNTFQKNKMTVPDMWLLTIKWGRGQGKSKMIKFGIIICSRDTPTPLPLPCVKIQQWFIILLSNWLLFTSQIFSLSAFPERKEFYPACHWTCAQKRPPERSGGTQTISVGTQSWLIQEHLFSQASDPSTSQLIHLALCLHACWGIQRALWKGGFFHNERKQTR